MSSTRIEIDDSVRLVQLATACAASGLEVITRRGVLLLRSQPERELAEGFADLNDLELLGRLRASFVSSTPVVREVVRRLEKYIERQAEVDAELERWEREGAPSSASLAEVRAQTAETRENMHEVLTLLGDAGAVAAVGAEL